MPQTQQLGLARKPWVRFARTLFFAPGIYALCDFLFSWNPIAAAPYWAHRQAAVFRAVPMLHFGMVAEGLNGVMVSLAFAAVFARLALSPWKRGLALGLVIWGFWVVSGTMSCFVWLDVPTSLAVANVLFGLPKSLVIATAIAWIWGDDRARPLLPATTAPAPSA